MMTCGFVFVARNTYKSIKAPKCKINLKYPLYPEYFKHYYSIAKWRDCYYLHRTILSMLPEKAHLRNKFYNITISDLKDIIIEYQNFLCKTEWEDNLSCDWYTNKKILKDNLKQLKQIYGFMRIYNNEGRLFYFSQIN